MREISSSASTSCTSAPPTTRATSAFLPSRISAAICIAPRAGAGSLTSASIDLDDLRIRIVALGRQHDDRARGLRIDDRQVVEIGRVAAAADDPRVPSVRHLGGDLVLHLDLVLVGHDDDARPLAALVGDDQFGDDVEDRGRPVEDDRVVVLEHARAALAQLVELASMPALSTPISAETTKMPPSVTASMTSRNPQPASPPMVPESRVRISDSQMPSTKLSGSPPSGAMRVSARNAPAIGDDDQRKTASQPISAIGPAAMVLSNHSAAARRALVSPCDSVPKGRNLSLMPRLLGRRFRT